MLVGGGVFVGTGTGVLVGSSVFVGTGVGVLVGSGVSDLANEAIAYGADKVYVADDAQLKDYQTDAYLAVMEKVVEQAPPQILLMGQTSLGRDLAPALALRGNGILSLHPAGHVELVDLLFDNVIAAEPREIIPAADLVLEFRVLG